MKKILLNKNRFTIVDNEDYEKFNEFRYYIHHESKFYYAVRMTSRKLGKRKMMKLHKEIMGVTDSRIVDHISGNTLDNRKCNLRIASPAGNARNRKQVGKNNTSGYKGVTWNKSVKKWQAQIKVNYKKINLGSFNNKEDAAKAYNEAAIKYHGEFARLNVIKEK